MTVVVVEMISCPSMVFFFFFFAHCIFAVQVVRKCFPVHLPATWTGYLSLTGCLKADDSTVERSSIFLQQFLLTCMWVGGVRDKWLKPSLGCLGGVSSKTLVIDKVFSSYSSFMSAHGLSRGSERLELLFLAGDRTFEPAQVICYWNIFCLSSQQKKPKFLVQARSSFQGAEHFHCGLKTYRDKMSSPLMRCRMKCAI